MQKKLTKQPYRFWGGMLSKLVNVLWIVGFLLQGVPCLAAASLASFLGLTPEETAAFQTIAQKGGLNLPGATREQLFPPRTSHEALLEDVLHLLRWAQEKLVQLKPGQERWQGEGPPAWIAKNEEELDKALNSLGIGVEQSPEGEPYDAVVLFGATFPAMKVRTAYLERLLKEERLNADYLVLLGGERYVTLPIEEANGQLKAPDGPLEPLQALAEKLKKPVEKLTETDLIFDLHQNSDMLKEKFPLSQVIVVNTPQHTLPNGDTQRPTTATTLEMLSRWIKKNPSVRRLCFISDATFRRYQEAIAQVILTDLLPNHQLFIACAGGAGSYAPLRQVHGRLRALGNWLWALVPLRLKTLELTEEISLKSKEAFHHMYAQNPLMYASLPSVLRGS